MHLPDGIIDLHVHSTASDGTLSPRELVALSRRLGLSVLSITDHDTVDGIPEAMESTRDSGPELIPGVELSVDLEHDDSTAHLLGYFPGVPAEILTDRDSCLGEAIEFVQNGRTNRNPRILQKLAEQGIEVDMETVRRISGGDVIGRPHIAEALVEGGYVRESREAFDRYLAKGKPAYVDRDRLKISDAINVILDTDGLPVLAHPGYIPVRQPVLAVLLERLTEQGLVGVEAYYPGHDRSMTEFLRGTSDRLGLVVTGGTDYHGWKPDPAGPGRAQGGFQVTRSMVKDFLVLCRARIAMEDMNGQAQ